MKTSHEHCAYLPSLNANSATSRRIYLVTVVALVVFAILSLFSAKDLIQDGGNLGPIHVLIRNRAEQPVASDISVAVVTPWSQMKLIRSGDVWSFPEGQVRVVPKIIVSFANESQHSEYDVFFSTRPLAADAALSAAQIWEKASWTVSTDNRSERELNAAAPPSLVLNLANRTAINWMGDLRFFIVAGIVPFTQVFSVWLLAAGFLWFGGAMQATAADRGPRTASDTQSDGLRVNGLDHIRGIAILMVYSYHCLFATFGYDQLGWNGWFRDFDHDSRTFLALAPVTFGFGGVAVFFALSGFCIHLSYERSRNKRWMTYFWRRLFRIYPPFLAALLFFAFFFPLTRVDFSYNGLSQFYSRLFLYFNLVPDNYWGINGSFWSVAVEMQLYLVYPFLLIAARHWGWRLVLWISFLIEIGLRFHASGLSFLTPNIQFPFMLQMGPFGYVFSWLIGAKLADDFLSGRALTFRRVPMYVWFLALMISLTFKPAAPFQFVLFSLTTVGVMARLVEGKEYCVPVPDRLKCHIAWVGMISYSVYLLHQPFLNLAPKVVRWIWAENFVHPIWLLFSCLAMYPLIAGLSWLMYKYVELPSIEAGKWFVSRRVANVASQATADALETSQIGMST